jgi:hypothetical protein
MRERARELYVNKEVDDAARTPRITRASGVQQHCTAAGLTAAAAVVQPAVC